MKDTKSPTIYELCDSCFKQGNYPTNDGTTEADFRVKSLPDHHWDKLSKELTQELENLAKAKPNTHLNKERQEKLMGLVMEHGDDWKKITELMGLKSKRETILEFLKLPLNNN